LPGPELEIAIEVLVKEEEPVSLYFSYDETLQNRAAMIFGGNYVAHLSIMVEGVLVDLSIFGI
jgi:hypothetical protein